MIEYRAAIHAVNNYYYVECKSRAETEQVISRWAGLIENYDDPYKFLEYKPFCYVRFDQIVGIELIEWDTSCTPVRSACWDEEEGQTTLDDFATFDCSTTSTTKTEEE